MTEHQKIDAATAHRRYAFTQADYLLLSGAGAFREYAKTELVDGTIYAVNATFVRHARWHGLFYTALAAGCARIDPELATLIEATLALSENDMPQPDIVVCRNPPDDGPLPAAATLLIVEIADSSLDYDLGIKVAMYGKASTAEYWVVDVNGRVIHQMWNAHDGDYADRRLVPFGTAITAATIDGLTVPTATL